MKSNSQSHSSCFTGIVLFALLSVIAYASFFSVYSIQRIYDDPQFTVGVVLPRIRSGKGRAFNYAYWIDGKRYDKKMFSLSKIALCSPRIEEMQHEIVGDTFLVAYAKGEPSNGTILMINSQYEEFGIEPLPSSKKLVDKISECEW